MGIDAKHPNWAEATARTQVIRDVLAGKLKTKRYIPDIDYRDQRRCARHRHRGVLVNFTRRTLNSFLGLIFKTAPVIEVPPLLEYVKTDTTGNKLRMEQLARECIREVFTAGLVGVFVDYPDVQGPVDLVSQDAMNLKARLYLYQREAVGNWYTISDSGSDKYTLVVLTEVKNVMDPVTYDWKQGIQYRVLKINDKGNYEVSILNDKGIEQGVTYSPRANGKLLNYIPFFVAGSEVNDINAENLPPLDSMAELNIGHLRNSCDFEEAAFLVGQASLFFTSSINESIMKDKVAAKPITLGSNTGHYLGNTGNSWLLQANETSMHTKGMADKIEQATMIGASILTVGGQAKTAEATRMDKASEVSVIETVINNVEDMLTLAIKAQADFMGADPTNISVHINHELIEDTADPQIMAQISAGIVQGFWPKVIAQEYARATGVIDSELTNEELDALSAIESPVPQEVDPFNNNKEV